LIADRNEVVAHLEKIRVGGQLNEVILSGSFEVAAIKQDQQLLVIAPPLKTEPLPNPVGVDNLDLLIRALKAGEGREASISFEDRKIHVASKHAGRIKLVTMAPETIHTSIDPANLSKVTGLLEQYPTSIPLSQAVVEGVINTFALLKAEDIYIQVKTTGVTIVVGHETSHNAEYDLNGAPGATQEFTLMLDGKIVTDVFKQLKDFTQSSLTLTTPNGLVAVREGAYTYIISPKVQ
jgi:hypothetical protein